VLPSVAVDNDVRQARSEYLHVASVDDLSDRPVPRRRLDPAWLGSAL